MPPSRHTPARLAGLCLAAMLSAASAAADENAAASEPQAGPKSPWGGNLSAYLWTAGMKADVSAGTHGGSVDASFIDIWDKSTRVPLGFMGRLEVHYERFGVFVDGNYMDIRLKPLFGRVSEGINSEMGLMDYGLAYRLFGAPASVVADQYQGRKRPNMLDVYVGARTLWIGNSISFAGPFGLVQRSPQTNRSLTAPYVGMRFGVDFTPQWFLLADANFGGFGVDAVSFTGGLLGAVGYRTRWFGVPTSLEAGFRAIRYNVDAHQATAANVTLNGPFIGLTGYW